MKIDMELYKVFYFVAECKSISRASEKLYISQPAISKSIKKLEDILGIQLFVRSSKGVRMTNEGNILFEHVKKAMSELSLGENIIEKIKVNEFGTIKISASTTLCKHVLIPHLKSFIHVNPHVKIHMFNKSTYETLKLLDEGIIDIGLVSQPFDGSDYSFIKLMDIHDVFVGCRDYLNSFNNSNADDFFSSNTIMLLEEDNITRKYVDRYMVLNNISAKPEIEIGNMDILIELAKLGLGITVLIKEFIQEELRAGTLSELKITPSIPAREIGIVYRNDLPLSIAAQTFIEHIISKAVVSG